MKQKCKTIVKATIIILSVCFVIALPLAELNLAYGQYPASVFKGYAGNFAILALNVFPVILLFAIFYCIFNRMWIAYFISGGLTLALSLANYYKLYFRDDPMYFEDLLIIREAATMTVSEQYKLFLNEKIVITIAILLSGTVFFFYFFRKIKFSPKKRLIVSAMLLVVMPLIFILYSNGKIYGAIENYSVLNKWSATQHYISRGFYYPFLHSISSAFDDPPKGYSEQKALQQLTYENWDIPEENKVNIISIMREAYIDFSQYGINGLDCSGYELYHGLEAESYTGNLLVNVFAGGTSDTERCFLTGNYRLKNFRGNTNSYVWYLREQGYTVEGSHPFYQWFYNRQNINGYLGFERYRFLENDYEKLSDRYMPEDSILLSEIYQDFLKNKETGKPYFSFSLNIQSHGPYPAEYTYSDKEYLTGNYSEECKKAVNNYFYFIMDSDVQLLELVGHMRNDPDPVIMVLFSDHLPWMGDGNSYYKEMGFADDLETEKDFRIHYSTRYLIWANDSAKKILNNDFIGEGPTISPCYLMNLAFQQCGWKGPAFMQAMTDMMEVFPVVTTNEKYVVDNQLVEDIPPERQELFQKFEYLQYFWRNNFLY